MTMLLQLLGFAALAAAMHATPQPLRVRDGHRRWVRIGGASALCMSTLAALSGRPPGIAILDWFGLATISAAALLLVLAVARARARSAKMPRSTPARDKLRH